MPQKSRPGRFSLGKKQDGFFAAPVDRLVDLPPKRGVKDAGHPLIKGGTEGFQNLLGAIRGGFPVLFDQIVFHLLNVLRVNDGGFGEE